MLNAEQIEAAGNMKNLIEMQVRGELYKLGSFIPEIASEIIEQDGEILLLDAGGAIVLAGIEQDGEFCKASAR